MSWKTLGTIEPTALVDARLQLHHAAQIVAATGVTFLDPEPDDSHPNLGWVESLGSLVGRSLPRTKARVGLRLADLTLIVVDDRDRVSDELALDGRTIDEGHAWLEAAAIPAGASLPPAGLTRATYDIPHHPTAEGKPFSVDSDTAFAELAYWFADAHSTLTELASRTPGASDVRCWPHHFDLASLVVVASHEDGRLAKSIGVGLSPGDDGYAEPYWYVSPWPYPDPQTLPALEAGGHWHTNGYTSAILTGSELLAGDPSKQSDRLRAFLGDAIEASWTLLTNTTREVLP